MRGRETKKSHVRDFSDQLVESLHFTDKMTGLKRARSRSLSHCVTVRMGTGSFLQSSACSHHATAVITGALPADLQGVKLTIDRWDRSESSRARSCFSGI